MANYLYKHEIMERGYKEIPENEWPSHCKEMGKFIDSVSPIIQNAECGWNGVSYKVMEKECQGEIIQNSFLKLYNNGGGERWICVTGNSKACNLSELVNNIW